LSTENGSSENDGTTEHVRDSQPNPAMQGSGQTSTADTQTSAPQTEGKRTQLKIVRQNIETLSGDIGNFRRVHENSLKRLEAQVGSIRKDLAQHTRSKELVNHAKSQDASNKKLEKQVATLRAELAAVKTSIAKDAARSRAKEEATLARILAKVSAKPKSAKPAKSTKKKR